LFSNNDALIYKMNLISCRRCSWLLSLSHAGYYGGHNNRKVFLLSFVLIFIWVGYHRGMIGNNTRKVWFMFPIFVLVHISLSYKYCSYLLCFLVIALVLGMPHVIALRGSYSDSCMRQQIRWSLVVTWNKLSRYGAMYTIVHIHIMKRIKLELSSKKDTFTWYIVSHMEIDCEEQKALNMTIHIPLFWKIILQIIRKS